MFCTRTLHRWRSVWLTLFVGWLGFQALNAAEPEVLFEDPFEEVDGSFQEVTYAKNTVEDNQLVIEVNSGSWFKDIYQTALFDDVDLSVEVQMSDPMAEKGAFTGLIFWGKDYNEFSFVAVSDGGEIGIFNARPDMWLNPFVFRKSSFVKRGADEWNLLRVVTVGNYATVYLNGEKILGYRGKPPDGQTLIGFVHNAPKETSSGRFRNLRVVKPTGDDAIVPEPPVADPNVIVSDDYSTLNPSWGAESGTLYVKDGTLFAATKPGEYLSFLYMETAVDIDATVNVRVTDDTNSLPFAGLIFWQPSGNDFSAFVISEDGQVKVLRKITDKTDATKVKWLDPVPWKQLPTEAKFQADAPNELRVVTSGKRAKFYVNGVAVGSTTHQTISGEWRIGLYAQGSNEKPATAEFSKLVVRKPTPEKKK